MCNVTLTRIVTSGAQSYACFSMNLLLLYNLQVGDYVEIVGNSSCGPLSSGDVRVVVETTNKAKGKT